MSDDQSQRPNTIVSDAFDRVMFDTYKTASRVIKEQTHKSIEAECLTEDVFNSMFKSKPEFMAESPQLQRELIEQMHRLPEYKDLRSTTIMDDVASAMASAKLAPDMVERLVQIQKQRQEQQKQQQGQGQPKGKGNQQIQQKDDGQGIPDSMKSSIRAQIRAGMKQAQEQIDQWHELAHGWGINPGELQRLPLKEKLELVKSLLASSKLRQIAELAGRLKNIANAALAMTPTHGNDELVDITQGDNIARLLPSELLKLKRQPTLFMKDLAERKLLQYNLRGEQPQGKGPIVMCVDVSGSMAGSREVWAKAVMLAYAHICDRQNRPFAVILFDTRVVWCKVYESGKLDLKEKMELAGLSMRGGGTAYMPPIKKAFEVIKGLPKMVRSDIVFITDGDCGLTPQDIAWVKSQKDESGVRFQAVGVGGTRDYYGTLEKVANDLVFIDDSGEIEHIRDVMQKTLTQKVS